MHRNGTPAKPWPGHPLSGSHDLAARGDELGVAGGVAEAHGKADVRKRGRPVAVDERTVVFPSSLERSGAGAARNEKTLRAASTIVFVTLSSPARPRRMTPCAWMRMSSSCLTALRSSVSGRLSPPLRPSSRMS
jgi:hypothetical protein